MAPQIDPQAPNFEAGVHWRKWTMPQPDYELEVGPFLERVLGGWIELIVVEFEGEQRQGPIDDIARQVPPICGALT